ncbi:MAG TPA: ABC transporter permease [Planctomycetota bacterium]
MSWIALKMLVGDKGKYFGILFGLTIASFLITQQMAIFTGLMTRTFGFITDSGLADAWVMDPKVQFVDDIKPLQDTQLLRVRGIVGVDWAVPLYKGLLKARLENGNFQTCNVVGLDDATLIGGPATMVEGRLEDLRQSQGIIVDEVGARTRLARRGPDGLPTPLRIGDSLELNDHRAVVVGLCRVSRTFQSQPVIYTTYARATQFAPRERKLLSFIQIKAKEGVDPAALCARITTITGLQALPKEAFIELTWKYFFKYTGIPVNFGIAVALGFVVGLAIAGQTFYNFTLENLKHFAALKAMGTTNLTLLRMVVLQALFVGGIGYGLGTGLAAWFGSKASANTELAFRLPWQILAATGVAMAVICTVAALISLWKVVRLEPAVVFKG